MYKYIPFNRPETWPEFLTHQEKQRRNSSWQEFAIIDKTRRSGPRLAGMISLINSSAEHLVSELGAVFVFPDFQVRVFVPFHFHNLLNMSALAYRRERTSTRMLLGYSSSMPLKI